MPHYTERAGVGMSSGHFSQHVPSLFEHGWCQVRAGAHDEVARFDFCHCTTDGNYLRLVFGGDGLGQCNSCLETDACGVSLGRVVGTPAANNGGDGVTMVDANVIAQQYKCGTDAIDHRTELNELFIRLRLGAALPTIVAVNDVEGIVISDSPWKLMGCLCGHMG